MLRNLPRIVAIDGDGDGDGDGCEGLALLLGVLSLIAFTVATNQSMAAASTERP